MRLHRLLGDMTFAVDRINAVRVGLEDRALKLPPAGLGKRLRVASGRLDELRKKIVATKEGGMITGEERLREFLTDLYSNLVFYEGRPSLTQIERGDAIARELADVVKDFDAWTANDLPGLNAALSAAKLEKLQPLMRVEWEKSGS